MIFVLVVVDCDSRNDAKNLCLSNSSYLLDSCTGQPESSVSESRDHPFGDNGVDMKAMSISASVCRCIGCAPRSASNLEQSLAGRNLHWLLVGLDH